MSYREIARQFRAEWPRGTDKGACRMAWAMLVDELCGAGLITNRQVNNWQNPCRWAR